MTESKSLWIRWKSEVRTEVRVRQLFPAGHAMALLIENMGRVNYGAGLVDRKGLLTKAPVDGNWTATCLPLLPGQVGALRFSHMPPGANPGPVFRRGNLFVNGTPADTFLDSRGFTKGYVWVNGKSLGRYWETAGPQHTLFLPAPFLSQGNNTVILLDLHAATTAAIESVAMPRFG